MKILFLLLLSFSLHAQELQYLKPEMVNLSDIPNPPAEGSLQDQVDLAQVIEWQLKRTDEDCTRAAHDAPGFAVNFWGPPYGPISLSEAERLNDLQEKIFKEVNYFSRALKKKWKRERPYVRDTRLTPCIPKHESKGYPSGHAAISFVAAKSFALIYPDKAKEFYKRADEIALGRVIGGVHHPLDILAGMKLGEKVFEALMKSPEFLNEIRTYEDSPLRNSRRR